MFKTQNVTQPALNKPRTFNENYKVIKILGSGSYGIVMLAVDEFGNKYAIKEIQNVTETRGVDGYSLREISLLKEIEHENVVRLFCFEYFFEGFFFNSTNHRK